MKAALDRKLRQPRLGTAQTELTSETTTSRWERFSCSRVHHSKQKTILSHNHTPRGQRKQRGEVLESFLTNADPKISDHGRPRSSGPLQPRPIHSRQQTGAEFSREASLKTMEELTRRKKQPLQTITFTRDIDKLKGSIGSE